MKVFTFHVVTLHGFDGCCRGSPTSQKVCFRHVKLARNMSLAEVLEEDYRLLYHMCHISNDFVEGIRAKLIEKDNNARWKPATIHEVENDSVHMMHPVLFSTHIYSVTGTA